MKFSTKSLILLAGVLFISSTSIAWGSTQIIDPNVMRCAGLDDVNGDGVDDYAYLYPKAIHPTNQAKNGRLWIISGSDGSLISDYWHTNTGYLWGQRIAVGDFDGDGRKDILIAHGNSTGSLLEVYDIATSTIIKMIFPPSNFIPAFFGTSLTMRDIDGDGKEEILCSSTGQGSISTATGAVHLFAGGTGALIGTISDPTIVGFGYKSEFVSDVDFDGTPEVLILSPGAAPQTNYPSKGHFGVYTFTSNTPYFSKLGVTAYQTQLGFHAVVLEDMTGDTIKDICVTFKPFNGFGLVRMELLSGRTGQVFRSELVYDPNPSSVVFNVEHNYSLSCSVADQDGDGKRDIALVGNEADPVGLQYIYLYSSANLNYIARIPTPRFGTGQVQFRDMDVIGDTDGDGFEDMLLGDWAIGPVPLPGGGSSINRIVGKPRIVSLAPDVALKSKGNHPSDLSLLTINGKTGGTVRRIPVGVGQSFKLGFSPDPTVAGLTDFIIFGMIGAANEDSYYSSAFGDFVLTPHPAAPLNPALFTVVDSIGFDPAAFFSAGPAPMILPVKAGISIPVSLTFQGVSITGPNMDVAISNAIILEVR